MSFVINKADLLPISIFQQRCTLVALYGPNTDSPEFYINLKENLQSVTKFFGQNTYLDFIPPLSPSTMLITAIIIFSSSTVTSTVNVISPKATLLRGEGRGAVQN